MLVFDHDDNENSFIGKEENRGHRLSSSSSKLARHFHQRSIGSVMLTTRNWKLGVKFVTEQSKYLWRSRKTASACPLSGRAKVLWKAHLDTLRASLIWCSFYTRQKGSHRVFLSTSTTWLGGDTGNGPSLSNNERRLSVLRRNEKIRRGWTVISTSSARRALWNVTKNTQTLWTTWDRTRKLRRRVFCARIHEENEARVKLLAWLLGSWLWLIWLNLR